MNPLEEHHVVFHFDLRDGCALRRVAVKVSVPDLLGSVSLGDLARAGLAEAFPGWKAIPTPDPGVVVDTAIHVEMPSIDGSRAITATNRFGEWSRIGLLSAGGEE